MIDRPISAAAALYPNLPSAAPAPPQRQQPRLADALYPSLAPKPKPPTNSARDSLLRGLRELNAKIDARLRRERSK
jgi:hypothetical protein